MRIRYFAACLLAAIPVFGSAGNPTFSIDTHVLAAGASVHSSNPCFRLGATVGESVAWISSSAGYTVSAGFRKRVPSAGDTLFFDGFEGCAP
jgi:hypothetical protein